MSREIDGKGCAGLAVLVFFVIYFIFHSVHDLIYADEIQAENDKKKREFVNYWKQSNIDFFKSFKCNSFAVAINEKIEVKKIFVFYSIRKAKCDIDDFRRFELKFDDQKNYSHVVEEIKDANILIWIKDVPGEKVGGYTDGSRAIRMKSEINFIDLQSKTVVQQFYVPAAGEPPRQISKKGYTSPSIDVHFGNHDEATISKIIESSLDH